MPGQESPLSFRAGDAVVSLDATGTVVSVVTDQRPGESFLDRAGSVTVRVDGETLEWSPPELGVDADEVEVVHRHPLLSATVRHSFAAGWNVRLALANVTAGRLTLDEVTLGWQPGADRPAWALAAGAVGAYVVADPDGHGPLLGGVLGLGALVSVSPTGLGLGRVVLEAGGRYVVSWQWGWYPHPKAFAHQPGAQRGGQQVPRSLLLTAGDAALITAGPDEALVLPRQVLAEPVGDQIELVSPEPGRRPVEIRTARGVTQYDIRWAEPVEELLVRVTTDILGGRRTPAGIVRLSGVEAALVVQLGLRVGLDDVDSAEEALDLYAARLDDARGPDPRTAVFLCGEFDRTGDEDAVDTATRIVLDSPAAVPGLGLAGSRVALARVLSGRSNKALTHHLAILAGELLAPGRGTLSEQTAALELAMLGPRDDAAPAVRERVRALGSWFGGGLPGDPVRPRPLAEAAHLAAVLAALDDQTSVGLRSHWACTAHELGRWTEARVVDQLTGGPEPREVATSAHAWLAVAAGAR